MSDLVKEWRETIPSVIRFHAILYWGDRAAAEIERLEFLHDLDHKLADRFRDERDALQDALRDLRGRLRATLAVTEAETRALLVDEGGTDE